MCALYIRCALYSRCALYIRCALSIKNMVNCCIYRLNDLFYCYCNTQRLNASKLNHYRSLSGISKCVDWTALCALSFVTDSKRQLLLALHSTGPLHSQEFCCVSCTLFHCCRQMLEHFIIAALSKSWIEAQPLPPRLSVSVREGQR
jgi:hypothetical protein